MKNKLTNLNDHLFEQLERLNDSDLKGNDLKGEIERSKATAGLAKEIVNNAALVLEAKKQVDKILLQPSKKLPDMFLDKPDLRQIEGGKS